MVVLSMKKIITTQANQFDSLDRQKWVKNLVKMLWPLATIYLTMLVANITFDGFQFTDFVPSMLVLGSMILYAVNTVFDAVNKYLGTNTYVVEKGQIK